MGSLSLSLDCLRLVRSLRLLRRLCCTLLGRVYSRFQWGEWTNSNPLTTTVRCLQVLWTCASRCRHSSHQRCSIFLSQTRLWPLCSLLMRSLTKGRPFDDSVIKRVNWLRLTMNVNLGNGHPRWPVSLSICRSLRTPRIRRLQHLARRKKCAGRERYSSLCQQVEIVLD